MSDLARALEITPQSVKRAVDSETIPPTWPLKIASQKNVSLDWLYFGRTAESSMDDPQPLGAPFSKELANRQPADLPGRIERLMRASDAKNYSELARALGIKPASVSGAIEKKSLPSSWFFKIAEDFNVSIDWLYYGPSSPHIAITPAGASAHGVRDVQAPDSGLPLVRLRLVGHRLDEHGALINHGEASVAFHREAMQALGDPDRMACLRVTNNEMDNVIVNNDLLVFDQGQVEPASGKVYVVAVAGELLVRTLLRMPSGIALWAASRPTDTQTMLPKDRSAAWIVGRVVWLGRAFG
ncbi:helix-turn-helix domain-containing protein [Megalodesulfovibrio gigas]|uniref:helix-turn-helix domain-containing protein n=1 Tax=Megalodesulfovibrio gigas TaxID=879 RepID=UPI00130E93C7|nr:helix-turn-helix domain-containing protein [Megalodesulfovibrio gigas]